MSEVLSGRFTRLARILLIMLISAVLSGASALSAYAQPSGGAVGVCPVGQSAVQQTGFAINAFQSDTNNGNGPVGTSVIPELIGPIIADGTFTPDQNNPTDGVFVTFFPSVDLDFTGDSAVLIPQGSTITLVLGTFFNNAAEGLLQASVDGVNFVTVPPGNIFFGQNAGPPFNESQVNRHFDVTVPAGGLRYIRVNQINGGFRVGGGQRQEICQPGIVTADAIDDAATVIDTTLANPDVINVVDNDTLDGNPFPPVGGAGSTTTLALVAGSSLPPQLTFDTGTGDVGVVAGAPNGTYTFDYVICETATGANCSEATVTIVVNAPIVAVGVCPAGQTSVAEQGFAINAFQSDANNGNGPVGTSVIPELIGPIIADGTFTPDQNNPSDGVFVTFFPSVDLDFTGDSAVLIPQGSTITLVLGTFFNNAAEGLLQASVDGVNFVTVPPGNIFFGQNAGPPFNESQVNRHFDVTVPAGGLRYIRVNQINGGFRVGGGQRQEICQPGSLGGGELAGTKTVSSLSSDAFSVPGADVLYTITAMNIGDGDIDGDSIFLVDVLPPEVSFLNTGFTDSNGVISALPVEFTQTNGAALDFVYTRDVGFSTASSRPTSFAECSPPGSLAPGANTDINFICFNPKGVLGAGNPSPAFSFRFTARIG